MKQQQIFRTGYSQPWQRTIAYALVMCAVICSCACSGSPLLITKTIKFRCDSEFNEGLRLPVDVVFVPDGESIDTITKVAPDDWFDSEQREQWQFKQSLSLIENGERNDVEVKLKKPVRTVGLVIMADYREIKNAEQQIVILDTGAKENEDIFVTIDGILHSAK
jgi:hypothetical protein